MPFDLVGFGEATPGANGKLAVGLLDTLYRVSGDDLHVKPQAPWLLGVACYGESTLGRTKIIQPTLPIDIEILKGALLSDGDPQYGLTDMRGRPLPLIPSEKLNVEVVNATDEDGITFLMLGSAQITQAMLDAVSPTHRVIGYADTTATAFTWSPLTVTWNQTLPKGRYAVVGMKYGYFKTTPAMPSAARLMFKEAHSAGWRPGVVGSEMQADHEEMQSIGRDVFADWPLMPNINFDTDNLPGVEVLSAEAHTDEEIELLLQKIG